MHFLPDTARVFPLNKGEKTPRPGSRGHHDAKGLEQFNFDLVPDRYNYGIALDGQFACLDIDDPKAFYDWCRDTKTFVPSAWCQSTRRGQHFLFEWKEGGTNQKLPGADLKVRGYIVGPGSVVNGYEYNYTGGLINPPPDWIAEKLQQSPGPIASTGIEKSGIPSGQHDEALFRLASWVRGQYDLDEPAIKAFLERGPMAVLEGYDPDRPYTDRDMARIARSAAGYAIEADAALAAGLRRGSDVRDLEDDVKFILPGFVPTGALTILYGDGKIGKSSWLSWLASRESRTGNNVIFIPSGEETFDSFVRRCRLNGADDGNLYEFVSQGPLLPKRVVPLQKAITEVGSVSLIVIDALYSHFDSSPGENEAVRARTKLASLAELAREYNVAVVGTIHENAAGGLLGSREMRNVARSLIHATRKKDGDLTLWSEGANAWSPDYGVTFPGTAVPTLDRDGNPLTFRDLFDEDISVATWKLELGGKAGEDKPDSAIKFADGIPRTNIDDIEEPTKEDEAVWYLRKNPKASWKEVANAVDASHQYIRSISDRIREKVNRNKDSDV